MCFRELATMARRPHRRARIGTAAPAIAFSLLALVGCRQPSAAITTQPVIPQSSNAELVEYISDQPYVSAEAAGRTVFVLATGNVFDGDYGTLQTAMRSNGLLPRGWRHGPGDYLTRDEASFLIAKAIHLRSGLNWRLTGLGRYAHRELIYRGIAHPGSGLKLLSGGEFLGMLERANEYLDTHGRADHAELGKEPR